jgi:hypothetical protein
MTTASAPAWEVTFLRRDRGSSRALIAGRLVLHAPDLDHARRAAEQALTERREQTRRSGENSVWSLGLLRPLTPKAPGTKRYRVSFAQWEAFEDHFERNDVHELELWAANAAGARRLAQQEIQLLRSYRPSWRIRGVEAVTDVETVNGGGV